MYVFAYKNAVFMSFNTLGEILRNPGNLKNLGFRRVYSFLCFAYKTDAFYICSLLSYTFYTFGCFWLAGRLNWPLAGLPGWSGWLVWLVWLAELASVAPATPLKQ